MADCGTSVMPITETGEKEMENESGNLSWLPHMDSRRRNPMSDHAERPVAGELSRIQTGVNRPVDDFGRIFIPIEMRRVLGVGSGDPVAIELDECEDTIVVKAFRSGCIFCGEADPAMQIEVRGRKVCRNCLEKVRQVSA